MRRSILTLLAILLCTVTLHAAEKYDLVIRNGRIIDGSGNAWFYGDVAINGDRIAAIGPQGSFEASKEIDANNHIVAPGFIDVHTHADSDMHSLPKAENFVRNGVTTIVTGNCGGSVSNVGEYFRKLESHGTTINVATLIGHNTILRNTKGDKAGDLTPEQMDKAKAMVAKAMEEGAVGLSTGLIYTPGKYSDTQEIIELQKVAASYGGIYASHIRGEGGGIMGAIDEAVRIGFETGSRVQISHFKLPMDVAKKLGGAQATLGRVMEARERGLEVWIDQYPYTASQTTITTMLPDWVFEGGRDNAREILKDEKRMSKLMADMRRSHEVSRGRTDLSYAVVSSSSSHPQYVGKNIKQIAQIRKLKEEKGEEVELLGLTEDQWPAVTMQDQYRVVIEIAATGNASCVYHTMAEDEVKDIMRHPLVGIASDSGVRRFNSGQPHPRGYGTNARVLGRYVRELQLITLEDAIRKMTSMPATAFRFSDRGFVRPGYIADIVVFDPDTIIDKATFEQPHQYSVGFAYVIVNGEIVLEDDELTGAMPGKPVRRE